MTDPHATPDRVAEIADAIRPALNIDQRTGMVRVSHGQDDIAEEIVRIVLKAQAL